jgi:hypothetical protein
MRGFAKIIACADPLRAAVLVVVHLLRTGIATQIILRAVAVTFTFTVSPAVASADVYGLCADKSICTLRLDGRIGPDDVALFKRSLEKVGGKQELLLFLNSEGGDITTAIEIGRLVRRWQDSHVVVALDSKCFSACVFVLAVGLNRVVHGKVGIHRPFNSTTDSQRWPQLVGQYIPFLKWRLAVV